MVVRVPAYAQLWARTPQASEDEEHAAMSTDSEEGSSELSELCDSATPSDDESPDTEMYESEDEGKCDDEEYYEFQKNDSVWVRPRGTRSWYQGVIKKVSEPTERRHLKRGPVYMVVFRRYYATLRDWFSPLEGNIKPDTPRVRAMLQDST
ncbi:hypothetical protein FKP32DRAFT_1665358 [Trametes sanguinea]|nr:hypothetical protein FKP32DRAFT_1665358 [Trametes sanguinea]